MKEYEKLDKLIARQIDVSNVKVEFKVEFKDKHPKREYTFIEDENGYRIERKVENRQLPKITVSAIEELEEQQEMTDEDKRIVFDLFIKLRNNDVDKIAIKGMRLLNPVLTATIGQSVIANLSRQILPEDRKTLYIYWKQKRKEEFLDKFYEIVTSIMIRQLKDKLESKDISTAVFPTGVASSETPNYYICEPEEIYTLDTKVKLFEKVAESICGRCGQRLYGLYVPEEGSEIKEILKDYLDLYSVNVGKIAEVGKINLREIGPFEYVFYLLDKVLQEMFRRNKLPDYHVELFVIEGVGGGKKFYSHYIIPNLVEVFYKLYHGDEKYWVSGANKVVSKIKAMVASFLVENWNIDAGMKQNNSEIAHRQIDRILYYIFCHRRLDMDAILFMEDLKVKLGDTTPILFLEEVISWI